MVATRLAFRRQDRLQANKTKPFETATTIPNRWARIPLPTAAVAIAFATQTTTTTTQPRGATPTLCYSTLRLSRTPLRAQDFKFLDLGQHTKTPTASVFSSLTSLGQRRRRSHKSRVSIAVAMAAPVNLHASVSLRSVNKHVTLSLYFGPRLTFVPHFRRLGHCDRYFCCCLGRRSL